MTSRGTARALTAAAALATLLGTAGTAAAYPQWQFSTGATRCNQCHFAPGGGGPLNGFGRDAVGEELSSIEGDGAFLHGKVELPSRLAVGGDLRGALLAHDAQDPDGGTLAAFPMQLELNARVAPGAGFSLFASVGLRGQVRDGDAPVPTQNFQPTYTSRLVSREHHVTWQPAAQGAYLRAGRFYAPFGLRLVEHVTFVRRDLGFNQLEESYNLSGGWLEDAWELHLTAFAPDVLRHIGNREAGFAGYFERRLWDSRGSLAGQTRLAFGPGMTRVIGGVVGKYWIERARTMVLAEVNGVRQIFDDAVVPGRTQLVAAGGVSVLPARGVMITLLGERNHEDIEVRDAAWNGVNAFLNWFPYPHLELQLASRLLLPTGGTSTKTMMLQLHYFL
jgi:hypothetical protein